MSRIGKIPVEVPEKIDVKINGPEVSVKGPKGQLSFIFTNNVEIKKEGKNIVVLPKDDTKKSRSLWGTTRALIDNMVKGVSQGFTKVLEFNGVGYKATVKGNKLNLSLGYSHPIEYELPKGINATVEKNIISISGCDKHMVGFVSAQIRSFRPPEPYKGKGIKYKNEMIIRKAGKTGAKV